MTPEEKQDRDLAKGYEQLCCKVGEIDKEAEKYMRSKEIRKLKTFSESFTLSCAFPWFMTPQGEDYWHRINGLLHTD